MKTLQHLTGKIAASLAGLALLSSTGFAWADNTGRGGTVTFTDPNGLNPVSTPPYVGGYVVHTFAANGTLTLPSAVSANVLVVAGGGGAGGYWGCGGGAGGLVYSNLSLDAGSYVATIGAGGAGSTATGGSPGSTGANGNNSTFDILLTALGGGGGGGGWDDNSPGGQAGGSGGGGHSDAGAGAALQPSSSSGGYGNAGFGPAYSLNLYGGGGGAGVGPTDSAGGDGLPYAISGVNTYYAGGGGGINAGGGGTGLGGQGGGGNGATGNAIAGGNGTANTGGGGGAGWSADGNILGFSQTHVSGTGGGAKYGNILVQPTTGNPSLTYSDSPRADEKASTGLYSVKLTRFGIGVEITAARHSAIYRFRYPEGAKANLLFDVSHCLQSFKRFGESQSLVSSQIHILSPSEVEGSSSVTGGWNEQPNSYTVYFYA